MAGGALEPFAARIAQDSHCISERGTPIKAGRVKADPASQTPASAHWARCVAITKTTKTAWQPSHASRDRSSACARGSSVGLSDTALARFFPTAVVLETADSPPSRRSRGPHVSSPPVTCRTALHKTAAAEMAAEIGIARCRACRAAWMTCSAGVSLLAMGFENVASQAQASGNFCCGDCRLEHA